MDSQDHRQRSELLLVACESKDPYSVTVVDPKTCVSLWAYKGNELQGAEIGLVEPVGYDGALMLIVQKNRPLVHCVAVNRRDRFHVKSILNKPLECVVVTGDGAVIFGAAESNIFTWLVSTGELLSVIPAHYQSISCLRLSTDDGLLISGALDGTVNVYLVSDILSWHSGGLGVIKPFRQWHAHSLKVSSISVTCLSNTRILSTSLDHVAAIHSVAMDECLLKISGDQALTASCFDPAETSVFLGTESGVVFRFPLYSLEGVSEKRISCSAKDVSNFYVGHTSAVTKLAINHDASLLASGDSVGKYIVWDAFSRQCLKTVYTKGSICKLKFIQNWESIAQLQCSKLDASVGVLQRSQPERFMPKKINLKLRKPSSVKSRKASVYEGFCKSFDKQLEKVTNSCEKNGVLASDSCKRPGDALANDDREVILIDEEQKNAGLAGAVEPYSPDMEISEDSDEIVSLRMRNADLVAEVSRLKTKLSFVQKKNQEIFQFASELILENGKK